MTDPTTTQPELPPGFTVHNDGLNREVLVDPHDDTQAHVFPTRAKAAEIAWLWWDSIYFHDMEDADGG